MLRDTARSPFGSEMPLFSIVIPTFNRRKLLRQTLDTVWSQTFNDYEVIVVDDGSTDGTIDLLKNFAGRLTALNQVKKGAGVARNRGAEQARGEYLAFLDSDDLWFPWTLVTFAALIRQYDFPSILSARLIEFQESSGLAAVTPAAARAEWFPDYLASHRHPYFVGAGMSVLRRAEFLKAGGFTDRQINLEDHDLILRMGIRPGFVQIVEPTTLAWRRHSGSVTRNIKRSMEGGRYLVDKEVSGGYPGGSVRRRERLRIVTSHLRSVALECLGNGMIIEAWQLYRATFRWHLALGRWKYLVGFPLKAISRLLAGSSRASSGDCIHVHSD